MTENDTQLTFDQLVANTIRLTIQNFTEIPSLTAENHDSVLMMFLLANKVSAEVIFRDVIQIDDRKTAATLRKIELDAKRSKSIRSAVFDAVMELQKNKEAMQ